MRRVYAVRGRAVRDLANALTLHFQAERGFQAVPDAGSNTLLLSGPKDVLDEATTVLREIDRPTPLVRIEVFCLELAAKAGGEAGADAKLLDGADLSGTARDVQAKVRNLQQKGTINTVKTVELTALAGQSARTQVSESRPFVTGVSNTGFGGRGGFGGGGEAEPAPRRGAAGFGGRGGPGGGGGMTTRSISYRNVGMSVQVKPEVGVDGQVTLELRVEDSGMRAAEGGTSIGTDDKGTAVPATAFVLFSLETRVKVRSGQVVLAEGTKAGTKAGQAQRIILVSASTE
jgi:type II secretory pathway component GspD/PulD (secretin)